MRQVIEAYAGRGVSFCAPEVAYSDAEKYLPSLLAKRAKDAANVPAALSYLRTLVRPLSIEVYLSRESDARLRLQGRDEDDWPILAASLTLGCPIWSEDTDFFGTGASVWTTSRVEIFLKAEAAQIALEDQ